MNPSEDPNDRLIDSLLSEQAKGKPDEALLRAVAAHAGVAPEELDRARQALSGHDWQRGVP